jgi:ribonuclease HII
LLQLAEQATLERRERLRISELLRRERALWRAGVRYVAGVDEVGIGPLAGPVIAAAVVFPIGKSLIGVNDSKRLDPETRTALAVSIRTSAIGVAIGAATVAEIDELNVYHAGLLAMQRAVRALTVSPDHILVDARTIPGLSVHQEAIVRGDQTNFSIAAASIVAKTHRDQLMVELDRQYPQYGFSRHKGYATAEHQAAIRRHGLCPLHRQSYAYLKELQGQYSPRFYELEERLRGRPSAAALRVVARELQRSHNTLSGPERNKLKVLLARRQANF